ncbi:MFS transporter [Microvirga thermotolerans]|uniref:MFS transporter n=1 Tax=Microvirga thermotolerans TaxID=2651334 RepID=A0A5P9K3K4_9HYPH|nr:MFS transporter [Microvirga thermotolerans]QFU16854.1 MFS transporter [Microvirga thermotolerans]
MRHDLRAARAATSALFLGNGFLIGTWAAQLPRFKAALGLSDGELSMALLAFGLGAVLLMPLIGWMTAAFGSGRVATAAAFAFAGTLVLPGLAPTLPALVAAAFVAGACNGTMDVSMNTNATLVERTWGRAIMSSFHAFFSLGGLLGAAASGALIARGLDIVPTLLVTCGGTALLFLAASLSVMREADRAGGSHGLALPRRGVLALAGLALLCFLVEGAMVDWSAIYLQTVAGASLERAVSGFAAFSLAMTACRFMGDFAVRSLGRVRTLMAGGLLAAAGLVLALAVPQPAAASAGFALVGLGLANVVPVLFSTAGETPGIPPSMGVAMVATLGYAGLLLGPPLIGFGADLLGLRAMFGLLALGALVVVLVARPVLSPRQSFPSPRPTR